MRIGRLLIALGLISLGGCTGAPSLDLLAKPELSPVGSGLDMAQPISHTDKTVGRKTVDMPVDLLAQMPQPAHGSPASAGSLWNDIGGDYFRNPRAGRVGDVLTIRIEIDDEAEIDNTTDRSKDASAAIDLGIIADIAGSFILNPFNFNLDAEADTNSSSQTTGQGSITRSERIDLSIAAVVTGVLPNGNLYISGSQEIRIDQEVRVLTIAGLVRPNDIAGDNTIPYDKIAEARISYGGRGPITEVQNPNWGQRVYDRVKPF